MADRKNPDYSASAMNLTNDARLLELLGGLYSLQASRQRQQEAIESFGSYQDMEAGHYALKQRRVTVTYSAAAVRTAMPDFAKAVIEETVNKAKIEGLAKGGLITPAQVEAVSTKAESFRYVIN